MAHQPTRLPYGLSFVKPGVAAGVYTLESSARPDVSYGTYFVTASSSITITDFQGGELGKLIFIIANTGGACVIQNSAGGIRLQTIAVTNSSGWIYYSATGGNATLMEGEIAPFIYNGTDWLYANGPRVVWTGITAV